MIIYSDTKGKRLNLRNVKEIESPYIASSQYEDVEAPDGKVFRRRVVLYKLKDGSRPFNTNVYYSYARAVEITEHLDERVPRRFNKAKKYYTDIQDAVVEFEEKCNDLKLPYRSNPVGLTYARGY